METKVCKKCYKRKNINQFYFEKRSGKGNKFFRWGKCKKCHSKYAYNWRKKNPEKAKMIFKRSRMKNFEKIKEQQKKYRKRHPKKIKERKLQNRYGISLFDRNKMIKKQEMKCAICAKKKKLVVDHNHSLKKVRAMLCVTCNFGLGGFYDNINFLKKAIKYLKKHDKIKT